MKRLNNTRTLLLNADYSLLSMNPLSTLNWQNAVKLEWTGQTQAVAWYDEVIVHSPSIEFPVPAVMKLSEYKKINRKAKFCLRNLYLRDNYTCQYCLKKFEDHDLTKDHVKPKSFGGKTNWENIVTSCGPCNHSRGNNERIRPHNEPYRPTLYELDAKLTSSTIDVYSESWIPFLQHFWNDDLMIKKY